MKSIIEWQHPDVLHAIDEYIDYEHLPKSKKPQSIPRTAEELRQKLSKLTSTEINRGSVSKQIVKRRIERQQLTNPTNNLQELKRCEKRRRDDGIDSSAKEPKKPKVENSPVETTALPERQLHVDGVSSQDDRNDADTSVLSVESIKTSDVPPNLSTISAIDCSGDKPLDDEVDASLTLKSKDKDKAKVNSNVKRRKRPLKVKVQYYRLLNTKLHSNMIVVPEDDEVARVYFIKDTKKTKSYARCYSKNCQSTGILNETTGEFVVDGHSFCCEPKLISKLSDEECMRGARKCANNGEPIGEAHWKGFDNATKEGGGDYYPEYFEQKTQLSRWASKHYKDRPTELNNGEPWLRHEDANCEVFVTDTAAKALAKSAIVVADATFEICPNGYYQVLSLHGLLQNAEGKSEYNNLMFALMRNKRESTYNKVVAVLQSVWDELEVECEIGRLHTDYEWAEMNAMMKLVGKDHVYGCLFHFSKALLKQVGELGLKPYYQLKVGGKYSPEYMIIRIWIRSLLSLPCLPKKDAMSLWKLLRTPPAAPEGTPWPTKELIALRDYYESTWISRPYNTWTFYGLGRVRNTNAAEAFHSAQAKTNYSKPRRNAFLVHRRRLAAATDIRIRKLRKSNVRVKPRSLKYKKVEERVFKLEQEYEEAKKLCHSDDDLAILMMSFSRKIATTLHDIKCKSAKSQKSAKMTDLKSAFDESVVWRKCIGVPGNRLYDAIVEDEIATLDESAIYESYLVDNDKKEQEVPALSDPPDETMEMSFISTDDESTPSDYSEQDELALDSPPPSPQSRHSPMPPSEEPCHSAKLILPASPLSEHSLNKNPPDVSQIQPKPITTPPVPKSRHLQKSITPEKSQNNPHRLPGSRPDVIDDDANLGSPQKAAFPTTSFLKDLAAKNRWKFVCNPYSVYTVENLHSAKPVRETMQDVKPDGNCGFRAISFALTGTELNHKRIREQIATYILYKAPLSFHKVFDGEVKNRAQAMIRQYPARSAADLALWMTHLELAAAGCLFGINIAVYTKSGFAPFNKYMTEKKMGKLDPELPLILIDNYSGNHFKVILNVEN